ncbi:MAG: HPF/RaiA family ribosome-associated protein, partial [Patescibacteria group bacterium]|nr:HPF/RaiA family ribosome-associated protein [Patescibacteria group bacterium]
VFRAEVNLDAGKRVYRAEIEDADMYAAIDLLVPRLVIQLEKGKLKKVAKARRQARSFKTFGQGI